jgi:hypothetical protein
VSEETAQKASTNGGELAKASPEGDIVHNDQVPGTSNGQEADEKKTDKIQVDTNDSDDILVHVEQILTEIHRRFFEKYAEDQCVSFLGVHGN